MIELRISRGHILLLIEFLRLYNNYLLTGNSVQLYFTKITRDILLF